MKQFSTYNEQINKLIEYGLIINDYDKAIELLKFEGYYNVINGYSPIFKVNGVFIKGTTFDEICALYSFDKKLRGIVYKYTSTIETHIKALIAHEFSRVHGVDQNIYLNPDSFNNITKNENRIAELISKCEETINLAVDKNSNKYREYICHNYLEHEHVPMWVLIRALSFGTVSIFYKMMKEEEKNIIAENYSVSSAQMANMLEVVVSYRNIVAHGERTYCAKLPKVRLSTELNVVKKLCIAKNSKGENKYGRKDFLSLLVCFKYLLPDYEFQLLMEELKQCFAELSENLSPSMMGKIKIHMGLASGSWINLSKIKVD